jgi:hypothetical protein
MVGKRIHGLLVWEQTGLEADRRKETAWQNFEGCEKKDQQIHF